MQEWNIIRSHRSLIRPQFTDIIRKSTVFLIRHSLPKGCSLRAGGVGVISPYDSNSSSLHISSDMTAVAVPSGSVEFTVVRHVARDLVPSNTTSGEVRPVCGSGLGFILATSPIVHINASRKNAFDQPR